MQKDQQVDNRSSSFLGTCKSWRLVPDTSQILIPVVRYPAHGTKCARQKPSQLAQRRRNTLTAYIL
jgi:hypothetical protein